MTKNNDTNTVKFLYVLKIFEKSILCRDGNIFKRLCWKLCPIDDMKAIISSESDQNLFFILKDLVIRNGESGNSICMKRTNRSANVMPIDISDIGGFSDSLHDLISSTISRTRFEKNLAQNGIKPAFFL